MTEDVQQEPPPEEVFPYPRGVDRSREFRAALALKGMTMRKFAEGLGVHVNHVYMVTRGQRPSRRIEQAVDALILSVFEDEAPPPPAPAPAEEAPHG